MADLIKISDIQAYISARVYDFEKKQTLPTGDDIVKFITDNFQYDPGDALDVNLSDALTAVIQNIPSVSEARASFISSGTSYVMAAGCRPIYSSLSTITAGDAWVLLDGSSNTPVTKTEWEPSHRVEEWIDFVNRVPGATGAVIERLKDLYYLIDKSMNDSQQKTTALKALDRIIHQLI